MRAGADDSLLKPSDVNELEAPIARARVQAPGTVRAVTVDPLGSTSATRAPGRNACAASGVGWPRYTSRPVLVPAVACSTSACPAGAWVLAGNRTAASPICN